MQCFISNSSNKEYCNHQATPSIPKQHSKNKEMTSNNSGGHKRGKRNKCDKLHKRNHENINRRLWRTIASKIRFQSDPI